MALASTYAIPETVTGSAITHEQVFDYLNEIFAAVVTLNSAAAASSPDTMYTYMPKVDSDTGRLNFRNAANNAWVASPLKVTETGVIYLDERAAPDTAASQAALYTKDTDGQPELFFREESSGDEVQITTAGHVKMHTTIPGNATIGVGGAGVDYTLTFDGETNDGVLTWMEDEDYFKFMDDVLINSTEKLYLGSTSCSLEPGLFKIYGTDSYIGYSELMGVINTIINGNDSVQFLLNGSTGMTYNSTGLNLAGVCQCDSLRIDQAPAAATGTCTHMATISMNGTDYLFPCVAA